MISEEHRSVVDADSVIFREGEPGDCAYIIERGHVEVSVQRNNRKVKLSTLSPGDLFGELALINDDVRSATVITLDETILISIARDTFHNKISLTDPVVALFLRALLERFHEVRERLLNLSIKEEQWSEDNAVKHHHNFELARDHALHEIKFGDELENALKNQEFEMYYQPIVDLKNKTVAGFEALVRWNHPQRGLLAPDAFIQFAEDSGQIVPIGSWIFEESCRAQKKLQHKNTSQPPFISINLSAKQFNEPGLIDFICDILKKWDIDASRIKLEITETLLMDNPQLTTVILNSLKKLGLTLAIDDFGTGYSSFTYLYQFPLDSLKVDRSFVVAMGNDAKSIEIIRALSALAHALHLDVIAEGVETNSQLNQLRDLGCDYGQGDYFSYPLPLNEASQFLANY